MTRISRLAVLALGAALLLTPVARAGETEKEPFGRLSVDEVSSLISAKGASIFDNNGKARFEKGHVPTAVWVSPSAINASVLPSDKDRKLVFYCGNEQCGACHQGAKAAIGLGYKNVFIMPAGIAGWEKAGKTTEKVTEKS
jgi:rhodanese-related sulfurtransferase